MKMKKFVLHNVREHRDVNIVQKYKTLDISLKFGTLDKMKNTSSDPKDYWRISGKGLINSLGIKTIVRSKNNKMESDAIINISKKNI